MNTMLEWLKRTLGADGLTNSEGVPREVIAAFAQDLDRLEKVDSSFPDIALRYVVDGAGDVPQEIKAGNYGSGMSWSGVNHDEREQQIRTRIYEEWDRLQPEMLIRFGTVLAATSPALSYTMRLQLAQKYPWIEALALELLGLPISHMLYCPVKPKPHALACSS
jgi:hypothetical protein